MKQVDDQLSHEIVEFYEKLSSWEASVVRGEGSFVSANPYGRNLRRSWNFAYEGVSRKAWDHHWNLDSTD